VALSAVILALVSAVAYAFGEVLFGELKLWPKAKLKRRQKGVDPISLVGP
jgi:hypothetical protein